MPITDDFQKKLQKEFENAIATYKPDYTIPPMTLSADGIKRVTMTLGKPIGYEEKGEEEWVWVTGYKGTDKDMKCRDYQFAMYKQFDMPEGEDIVMCSSGFHFCDKLSRVYNYYDVKDGNRFFEVKALVRRWKKDGYYKIEQYGDKMVAKSIKFVRELSIDEIFEAAPKCTDIKGWSSEQKEIARQTNIENVRMSIKIAKLVKFGYSEAFAAYVCHNSAYDIACIMGETPNVSMDVKVLTICMNMNGSNFRF